MKAKTPQPSNAINSEAALSRPFKLQAEQEARRSARLEELKQLVRLMDLPADVLDEITQLGPVDSEVVLQEHPGYALHRKLESLWQMQAIFEKAHADSLTQIDRFDQFSRSEAMHLINGAPERAAICTALSKELFAFSASAGALVEFSRRLKNIDSLPSMVDTMGASFDEEEHRFVVELRNVVCHQLFPQVGWLIEYSQDSRTVDFSMSSAALLKESHFSTKAKAYIRRSRSVYMRPLLESYGRRVKLFYDWYRDAVEQSVPTSLQEYRRLNQARKAMSAQVVWQLTLEQWLRREIDPYSYLNRYLSPEQIQKVMDLPMRSAEQVDAIIAYADTLGACNDRLRKKVYRLFDVVR